MERTKVILFGYGNTGKLIAGYVERHGGELKAVIDCDPRLKGTKAGKVTVSDDIAAAFAGDDADIAVISIGGGLAAVAPTIEICLKHGVNVITSSEEAIFPQSTSPQLMTYLDALARANFCTVSASGFQDCFWIHAVTAFASSVSTIDRIKGVLRYNVDEYGASLAADHGVGLTVKEFNHRFNGDFIPSYLWNVNELLAAKLGWGAVTQAQKCIPYVHHDSLYSASYGGLVEKGRVVGMSALVTTETQFGGVIETECIGKVYAGSDHDLCSWSFVGEPSLSFEVNSPKTLEHTAASLVNRIPQVINAAPGYITIDRLGYAEYLTFPMFLYK